MSLTDLVHTGSGTRADVLFLDVGGQLAPSIGPIATRDDWVMDLLQPSAKQTEWLKAFPKEPASRSDAESMAVTFRNLFYGEDQVMPLLDLPQTVANHLRVIVFVVNASQFDGASALLQGVPFIFVRHAFPASHAAHSGARSWATWSLITTVMSISLFLTVSSEEFAVTKETTERERFAHAFASSVLLPGPGVGITLKKVREMARVPSRPTVGRRGDLVLVTGSMESVSRRLRVGVKT